jgi:hypothetical protein
MSYPAGSWKIPCSAAEGIGMGQPLFRVAECGPDQRPGTVAVVVDYAFVPAPGLAPGQWLEFRSPSGGATRARLYGLVFVHTDPDRPSVLRVQPEPPGAPIEAGAQVWSLTEE